jgi:hypothetical protein
MLTPCKLLLLVTAAICRYDLYTNILSTLGVQPRNKQDIREGGPTMKLHTKWFRFEVSDQAIAGFLGLLAIILRHWL